MSAFDVTFKAPGGRGAPSGLEGEGTLSIGPTGLTVRGRMKRKKLATGLAVALSLVAVFFALLFLMDLLDGWIRSDDGDMRLFVAIGLVIVVGAFAGFRALLVRFLPRARIETTFAFPFVSWVNRDRDHVEVMTHASSLEGLTAFDSPHATRFVDELEAAKRGPQAGYRATA